MSVQSAIYTLLAAATDVTDLTSTRIYYDAADQAPTKPYITIFKVSDVHVHHMGGASGITEARIQVDAYAASPESRQAVFDAVRNALDGYVGTSDSVVISKCFLSSDNDLYIAPYEGERFGTYRSIMDFEIAYFESVPTF